MGQVVRGRDNTQIGRDMKIVQLPKKTTGYGRHILKLQGVQIALLLVVIILCVYQLSQRMWIERELLDIRHQTMEMAAKIPGGDK